MKQEMVSEFEVWQLPLGGRGNRIEKQKRVWTKEERQRQSRICREKARQTGCSLCKKLGHNIRNCPLIN